MEFLLEFGMEAAAFTNNFHGFWTSTHPDYPDSESISTDTTKQDDLLQNSLLLLLLPHPWCVWAKTLIQNLQRRWRRWQDEGMEKKWDSEILYNIYDIYRCVSMCKCTCGCRCHQRPEDSISSLDAEIAGGYNRHRCLGTRLRSLKSSTHSKLGHLSSP